MEESAENLFTKALLQSDDLFDAEIESESELANRQQRCPPLDQGDSDDGSLLANRRGRNRKKGDGQAQKRKRSLAARKKAAKKEIQFIHSESQRLLRERSINLPRHTPKPKSIEEVIAKMNIKPSDKKLKSAKVQKEENCETDSGVSLEIQLAVCQKVPVLTPKLSERSDAFFSDPVPISNKVGTLMERFMQHVTTEKKPKPLNEKAANSPLKRLPSTVPGDSRQLLHQHLQESIRIKRAAQREQSMAARKLDEEEIGNSDDEEEAELTDEEAGSSSDSESEDERENNHETSRIVPKNEGDTTDGMGKLELSNSADDCENSEDFAEDSKGSLFDEPKLCEPNNKEQQETFRIRRHINFGTMTDLFDAEGSDNEFSDHGIDSDHASSSPVSVRPFAMFTSSQPQSDSDKTAASRTPLKLETDPLSKHFSFTRADSNASSTQSALQTPGRMCTPDIFSSRSFSREGSHDSVQKLSMPVEDSQDLYNDSGTSLLPGQHAFSQPSFRHLESLAVEEESRLFDSQGFLKVKKGCLTSRVSRPPPPMSESVLMSNSGSILNGSHSNSNSQDSNMEELLGLCSGSFSVPSDNNPSDMITSTAIPETNHKLFEDNKSVLPHGSTTDTADTMDELVALCSGEFPSQRQLPAVNGMVIGQGYEEDNKHHTNEKKSGDSDSCQSDEEIVIPVKKMKSDQSKLPRLPKLGKSLRTLQLAKFLEEEAELSGSDDGSLEDDENSDMDEYEEEGIADEEAALLSSIELQRQVEKIHNKEMLMQDREDVEAFKDRYLGEDYEEGIDLKTGLFRTKRYVRQFDEGSQTDMFSQADVAELVDDDQDDSCSQLETERRKQRFERDSFLKEKRLKEDGVILDNDENSQSILSLIKDDSSNTAMSSCQPSKAQLMYPVTPKAYGRKTTKTGSFLKRRGDSLNRLSAATTIVPNLNGATRNFIFQSVESDKGKKKCTTVSSSYKVPLKSSSGIIQSCSRKRNLTGNSVFTELHAN